MDAQSAGASAAIPMRDPAFGDTLSTSCGAPVGWISENWGWRDFMFHSGLCPFTLGFAVEGCVIKFWDVDKVAPKIDT